MVRIGERMTETKRFKIVDEQFISYYGGTGYKISNEECGFWLWHNKNESQKVCDKLNSILDENGQLRKENDMLSCELSVSANKEISRNCRIAELEEENEQLKQHNVELINKIDFLERVIDGDVE